MALPKAVAPRTALGPREVGLALHLPRLELLSSDALDGDPSAQGVDVPLAEVRAHRGVRQATVPHKVLFGPGGKDVMQAFVEGQLGTLFAREGPCLATMTGHRFVELRADHLIPRGRVSASPRIDGGWPFHRLDNI